MRPLSTTYVAKRRVDQPSARNHSRRSCSPIATHLPGRALVSAGTRRAYSTYWNRVIQAWGPRPITSVTPLEVSQLAEQVKTSVVQRRNARGGRGAAEHLIAALRCIYKHAVADGILTEDQNFAARVPKPRRLRSTRRALPDKRLEELSQAAGTTGG